LTLINDFEYAAVYGSELLAIPDLKKLAISIYPNPVQNILRIKPDYFTGVFDVKIYDLKERLTLTKEINTTSNSISVENLEPGVYFILLESNQGKVDSIKFIKK
jgi:hypothetical protein